MNNRYAKFSIISYCLSLAAFIPFMEFADKTSTFQTLGGLSFILLALISIVTGIMSLTKKENNKILPTISLSTASFCIYVMLVFILKDTSKVIFVEKGTATNYGIFDIPTQQNDSTKNRYLFDLRYLKENTDSIPALKGTHFGFNYVISGNPKFDYVDIKKVTKYPEPGLKKNNKYIHSDSSIISVSLNDLHYSGFQFEYDYELIPGKWEFEMSYKGSKLFSKAFNVYSINSNSKNYK
jgi:Domain of unknown function (DUF3859)